MNSLGVLAVLAAPYAPQAAPFEIILALVMARLLQLTRVPLLNHRVRWL
jgi:hypothetical protein